MALLASYLVELVPGRALIRCAVGKGWALLRFVSAGRTYRGYHYTVK